MEDFKAFKTLANNRYVSIVDIGWHGTFHKELESHLGRSLSAYFLGLFPEVKISKELNGFLFDFNHDQENAKFIRLAVELIELIFSEPVPSILRYARKDTEAYEVFRTKNPDDLASAHMSIQKIQKSAFDFVEKTNLIIYEKAMNRITQEAAGKHLSLLTSWPTKNEVAHFAEFPISVAAGNSIQEPLLSTQNVRWAPAHKYLDPMPNSVGTQENFFRKLWNRFPTKVQKNIRFIFVHFAYGRFGRNLKRFVPNSFKTKLKLLIFSR
jgi:hypothetical protein